MIKIIPLLLILGACSTQNTVYPCTYSANAVSTNGDLAQEYLRIKEELKVCSGVKQ